MPIAAVTSIPSSTRLTRRPSVASIARLKRTVPPPERMWAAYKAPPWWTAVAAFIASIAIHIGAVAVFETGPDGRLARLWETRILEVEERRTEESDQN